MLLRAQVDRPSEDSSLRIKSDIAWSEFQENKSILGKAKNKNHPSPGRLWLWTDGKEAPFTSWYVCEKHSEQDAGGQSPHPLWFGCSVLNSCWYVFNCSWHSRRWQTCERWLSWGSPAGGGVLIRQLLSLLSMQNLLPCFDTNRVHNMYRHYSLTPQPLQLLSKHTAVFQLPNLRHSIILAENGPSEDTPYRVYCVYTSHWALISKIYKLWKPQKPTNPAT